mmetsp:Transcript_98307/g.175039  ORF Transcript_98307/g.175039 Transcript_98307/m.175039 type:complete len:209 (-) Transcript_98307:382-1008(-)
MLILDGDERAALVIPDSLLLVAFFVCVLPIAESQKIVHCLLLCVAVETVGQSTKWLTIILYVHEGLVSDQLLLPLFHQYGIPSLWFDSLVNHHSVRDGIIRLPQAVRSCKRDQDDFDASHVFQAPGALIPVDWMQDRAIHDQDVLCAANFVNLDSVSHFESWATLYVKVVVSKTENDLALLHGIWNGDDDFDLLSIRCHLKVIALVGT